MQSLIAQIVQPQIDFYAQQRAALEARQAAQREAFKQISGQLLGMLSGVPAQINADYDRAIAETTGLSQAAAQGLANANPNPETLANLQAINAPQQQIDAVSAQNQNVFGGGAGVLNFLGGTVPAQGLVANRAAESAYARTLPFASAANANQYLSRLLSQQAQQQLAIDQALAKIRSDATSQAYDILNQLQSQKMAQQRFQADQQYRRSTLGLRAESLRQSQQRINQSLAIAKDRSAQGWARVAAAQDAQKNLTAYRQQSLELRRAGLISQDEYRRAQLWIRRQQLDLSRQRVSAGGGARGVSASQMRLWSKTAHDLYNGVKDSSGNVVDYPAGSYQEALAKLRAMGAPLAVAQGLLNTYWKPGEDGRPYLSYQERQALIKAGVKAAVVERAAFDGPLAARLRHNYPGVLRRANARPFRGGKQ